MISTTWVSKVDYQFLVTLYECDYRDDSVRRRRRCRRIRCRIRCRCRRRRRELFHIFDFFSKTAAGISFKFGVEVPQVDVYQVC